MAVPLMDTRGQYAAVAERINAAMARIVASGIFIRGPHVKAAELAIAADVGVEHAVGVANGTDALVIALEALGVGAGDEVICPSFTFFATGEAVAQAGARPVFADIEADTYCLDVAAVAAAITPRTSAVVAVHLFGHPADTTALRAVCDRHGLALIEDAAQAYGSAIDDRRAGAIGDAATFSFYPTKNLPCFGDGGMITTPRGDVAETCRILAFHGSRDKKEFLRIGYNSRLDELQAAVLLELLPLVHGWNDARIAAAARYASLGLGDVLELPAVAAGARHVYHLYVCRSGERDRLRAALAEREIASATYYDPPTHLQPAFAHLGYVEGSLPETERASKEAFSLPMYPTIDAAAQEQVVEAVRAARLAAA